VLVGVGYLGPVNGTVYVDEHRVLRGSAVRLRVEPDREIGLAVTVTYRRFAGVGRRPRTTLGRAVQIGTTATTAGTARRDRSLTGGERLVGASAWSGRALGRDE